MTPDTQPPVVVIGAGPVGLAAAARLVERGISVLILERGLRAAAALRAWGHVRVFTPWEFNIDDAARALLASTGWRAPDPRRRSWYAGATRTGMSIAPRRAR